MQFVFFQLDNVLYVNKNQVFLKFMIWLSLYYYLHVSYASPQTKMILFVNMIFLF